MKFDGSWTCLSPTAGGFCSADDSRLRRMTLSAVDAIDLCCAFRYCWFYYDQCLWVRALGARINLPLAFLQSILTTCLTESLNNMMTSDPATRLDIDSLLDGTGTPTVYKVHNSTPPFFLWLQFLGGNDHSLILQPSGVFATKLRFLLSPLWAKSVRSRQVRNYREVSTSAQTP